MHKNFLSYILFLLPPEASHHLGLLAVRALGILHRLGIFKRGKWANHERLSRETPFGRVDSPLGLAAGFDKNAVSLWGWQALGFAFVEVGTVTPKAQPGNPKPRLFRFVRHHGIVNRMGFNNDGVKAVAARITKAKSQGLKIKVGGNIGKNLNSGHEGVVNDYRLCAKEFKDCVDYIVINVSSPNTPGLRELQNETQLDQIVGTVKDSAPNTPLFIKVAPDNFEKFFAGVIAVAKKYEVAGVICGNTLANHASAHHIEAGDMARLPSGGLSGRPIFENNLKLCEAYSVSGHGLFVIGVGGIDDHFKAIRYFQAQAKLIQVYSGLVFGGPGFVKNMLKSLIESSLNRHQQVDEK